MYVSYPLQRILWLYSEIHIYFIEIDISMNIDKRIVCLFLDVVDPVTHQAVQTNHHTALTRVTLLSTVLQDRQHPKISIQCLIDIHCIWS